MWKLFSSSHIHILTVLLLVTLFTITSKGVTILNPTGPVSFRCLDCICETVSDCQDDLVCIEGDACGRFRITPYFWIDAGKPTVHHDNNTETSDAFINCVTDKECAVRTIQQYMDKHKKDCNGDGAIDCKDFFALHIQGASVCNKTLHDNFEKRFNKCDQPLKRNPSRKDDGNIYLPNYDDKCIKCLCDATTGCNKKLQCDENDFCGVYNISKNYWIHAGKTVLPGDDADRNKAFKECALNPPCAEQTVRNYLKNYGKDCNEDGVTDCYDYLMIQYYESEVCSRPVEQDERGKEWLRRYNECMLQEFK